MRESVAGALLLSEERGYSECNEPQRLWPTIMSIVLSFALLAGLLGVSPPPAAAQDDGSTPGDVNCDARVDVTDALLIAQFTVSARTAVAACPLTDPARQLVAVNGDMNRSGSTDIVDALLVAQCSAGLTNLGCARQSIDLPAPFASAEVFTGTDGFVPVTVGQKTYTIAHRGAQIGCADVTTGNVCWPQRSLAPGQSTTMQVHNATAVGTDIYFLLWIGSEGELPNSDGALRLACWNTLTDSLCANRADMVNVGHGSMHATNGAVWVFAADRKVYCFVIGTLVPCPTYGSGRNTSLGGEPGWGEWNENSAWNSDVVEARRRVYVTLSNRGQVWLHCWDAAVAEPCVSFEPTLLNETRLDSADDDVNGRLFFDRSNDGSEVAICSQGSIVKVECYHLITGADAPASEAALFSTLNGLSVDAASPIGISSYHAASNRQFFVGSASASATACYDFNTAESCGTTTVSTAFGNAEPYGYEDVGDCLYGFGHAGVLFSMRPDLSIGCGAETVTQSEIRPGGDGQWGLLAADRAAGYTISIRISDANGRSLLPAGGGRLVLDDTPVNLNVLPSNLQVVVIDVAMTETPGELPPIGGPGPRLLIG